jgi:hypothetical protein
MKPYFLVVAATAFGLSACDQVKKDAQTAVEKTGDAVTATAEGTQAVAEGAWDATKATGQARKRWAKESKRQPKVLLMRPVRPAKAHKPWPKALGVPCKTLPPESKT